MKVDDYFAAGNEPPLLPLLLETVDDEEIFPHGAADKVEKPAELATGSDGKIYVKSPAVTRKASPEELQAFQQACRQAITGTAGRKDLTEEDAVPFLYYMMGVFVASREEWFWQRERARTGAEKP